MFGDNNPENNASANDVNYWLSEATRLKFAAELCWSTDENIQSSALQGKAFGADISLLDDTENADIELKWLFMNLMAFSIQHLAIAILVNGNSRRFFGQPPGYRIVELLEECGIEMSDSQHKILLDIENGFKWSERTDWNIKLSTNDIRTLARQVSSREHIDIYKKNELERLYEIANEQAEKLISKDELDSKPLT